MSVLYKYFAPFQCPSWQSADWITVLHGSRPYTTIFGNYCDAGLAVTKLRWQKRACFRTEWTFQLLNKCTDRASSTFQLILKLVLFERKENLPISVVLKILKLLGKISSQVKFLKMVPLYNIHSSIENKKQVCFQI